MTKPLTAEQSKEYAVTALVRWSAVVALHLRTGDTIRAIRAVPMLRRAVRDCLVLAGVECPTREQVDAVIPPLARL